MTSIEDYFTCVSEEALKVGQTMMFLRNCTTVPVGFSFCVPLLPEDSLDDREVLVAETVETLAKALQAGWFDVEKIKADSDLEPIRERDDFRQIASGMDENPQPQ